MTNLIEKKGGGGVSAIDKNDQMKVCNASKNSAQGTDKIYSTTNLSSETAKSVLSSTLPIAMLL